MTDLARPARELRDTDVEEAELVSRLRSVWSTPAGLIGRLSSVDHKVIGRRYILTAFFFLGVGGIAAALMRLQLAHSQLHVLTPERYNELFTMHGSTMMFLFAVPVMEAFAV